MLTLELEMWNSY